MLMVLILLWSVGALLLLFDGRNTATRWLAAVTFCGGSGAMAVMLVDHLMPYAAHRGAGQTAVTMLERIGNGFSLIQYYGLPYCFVMFAVCYHPGPISATVRTRLPYVLIAAPAAMPLLTAPVYPIPYAITLLWAGPYIALGAWLILSKRETSYSLRRNHLFTSLAVVPAVLLASVMNYVLPALGYERMWRYNTWIILLAVLIFLAGIFRFGFLGIRLFIEKRNLDSTLRAVTSGTAILNHAIKNDVGKIKLFGDKIRHYAKETGQPELGEDIRIMLDAARHIQEMVNRVQDQTQELVLRTDPHRLTAIAEPLIRELSPRLTEIEVLLSCEGEPEVLCDEAQVAETLGNVLSNAIEAMPSGGRLDIRIFQTKRQAVVEVRDTGSGIAKSDLRRVMEPFFTTKGNGRHNFGLGLAYSYHVMKKHGGRLDIESEQGKGTAVRLSFPLRGERRRGWRFGSSSSKTTQTGCGDYPPI